MWCGPLGLEPGITGLEGLHPGLCPNQTRPQPHSLRHNLTETANCKYLFIVSVFKLNFKILSAIFRCVKLTCQKLYIHLKNNNSNS